MNFRRRKAGGFSAAELAAAEWLMRRESGMTREQEEEFQAWLAADIQHARAFHELENTWTSLDRVSELRSGETLPDPDALAPARLATLHPRSARSGWKRISLAAAAVVVLAGAIFWRSLPEPTYQSVVTTQVGEVRSVELPDGSVIRLNTGSEVRVDFTADKRTVGLVQGEAHFTVAPDRHKPFVVSAAGVEVRAVGTAFNVRVRETAVDVLVTEGRVLVDQAELTAGRRLVVPLQPSIGPAPEAVAREVDESEINRSLAWQARRLEFLAAPLAEIVSEFNRYNRHQLVIADGELARRRFGGTFRADSPETLTHLLESNYGVEVERRDDRSILRLAR